MKLKLSFYLARRYLMARWSLMSTLSILMISFGVITLITVMSIMNGFHSTFRRKILETNTYHIVIEPYNKNNISTLNIKSILSKNKDIISIIPYYDGEAVLKGSQSTKGILVKAFPQNILEIDSGFRQELKIPRGDFDLTHKNNIILGEELSRDIGVGVGDFVSLITFRRNDTTISASSINIFRVKGMFKTGYWEYDKNMAYISLDAAFRMFGIDKENVSIGIKIRNIFRVDKTVSWMRKNGLTDAYILTWMDINRPLFEALHNEKVGIGFVVMLIIISGAFNIIGSLVMTIMDKRKEIGILRAVGAPPSLIMRVFILDGFYIGIIGTVIGVFIGFFLTLNIEAIFSLFENIVNGLKEIFYYLFLLPLGNPPPQPFEILSDSIYYLEGVPVEIHFMDVFIICILAIIISVIAAYYPAKKAALTKPSETIRYE